MDQEAPQETSSTPIVNEAPPSGPAPVHLGKGSSMRFGKWLPIGIVVAVLVAGGIFAWWQMSKKTTTVQNKPLPAVKIGVLLPLSAGGSGGFGMLKGIELAKKQLGATTVTLVQEDSKCDGEAAAAAIQKLIAQGVVAVIGDACSGGSLGALKYANSSKVPMVSPVASSPKLSIANDYFFRVVPPDEFQGKFIAQLLDQRGYKKVAILHTDEAYGNSLRDVFKKEFEALGGMVVSVGAFAPADVSLNSQVNALKAAQPDAVFLASVSVPSSVAALQLTRDAGVAAPFYGADAAYDKVIITDAQGDAEGLTATAFSTGSKSFKQAMANAYPGEELAYGAAEGYDSFQAIFKAIQKGASTGQAIQQALSSMSFNGVTGTIKFDKNGEISTVYDYILVTVKDGAFVPVE
jgi:branched-chain amino acid transport system substrate-binding protein